VGGEGSGGESVRCEVSGGESVGGEVSGGENVGGEVSGGESALTVASSTISICSSPSLQRSF